MITTLTTLLSDESGASMVEYGLLIALIAMVAITAVRTLGTSISTFFTAAGNSL